MANEYNTRALFEKLLEDNDFKYSIKGKHSDNDNCVVEGEKSECIKIAKLLKNASKKGKQEGRPDYIISSFCDYPDLLIICECKADTKFHESSNHDKYTDYAVDGVLLYSSFLSKEYDVINIAISGESESNYKISTFLQLKGEIEARNLNINNICKYKDYIDLYSKDEHKFNQDLNSLLDYSRVLNNHLHSLKIPEGQRSLLISGCLIALQDKSFCASYKLQDSRMLINNLLSTIQNKLQNVQNANLNNIITSYTFITTSTSLSAQDVLKNIIVGIQDNIDNFIKTHKYYDTLGQFYIEFLRYANNDKGLGIVLTPPHITEFFCELANVNKESIVYDNCCGTGGFLISALDKMVKETVGDGDKEAHIKSSQLIGVEFQDHIYTMACSNMFIHGDGRSHLYKGDCFDKSIKDEVIKLKPNVGFLNPPYKSERSDVEELKYVLNNLECLQKGSYCIAIVPMSCAIATSQDRNKTIYDLKKELLENHTLDAVFSMPDELFVNSKAGTVTCIMVFKAKEMHPVGYKTYFAYCKDDGFTKKRTGRADYYNKWQDIKKEWISAYRNRDEVKYYSIKKSVTANDEWCAEAYLPTNYSNISEDMFVQKLKNYCLYLFSNKLTNSISINAKNNTKVDQNKRFDLFKIENYFDIFSGGDKPHKDDYDEDNGKLINSVENQVVNNGIKEQIYFDKEDKIFQNFISVVSIGAGGTAFYQPETCSCFTRVKALLPKSNVIFNSYVALYLCVNIDMERFRYGYGRVVSKDRLAKTELYLPTDDNGNPDWDYMEQYIKSLPYSSNL